MDLNWVNVNKQQSFKTVFLGDSHVGKTCLARLFVEGVVVEQCTNTIGFDHHVREIHIQENLSVKVGLFLLMVCWVVSSVFVGDTIVIFVLVLSSRLGTKLPLALSSNCVVMTWLYGWVTIG